MDVVWHRRFRPLVVYRTSGTGQWCLNEAEMLVKNLVLVRGVEVAAHYLLVYFDDNKWDTAEDGYVVNDPGWNQCLRNHLKVLKFSDQAVATVNFEDMDILNQNDRRVVIPVGEQFVQECDALVRFVQGESDNEQLT
jgi:hypothetical protein